MGHKRMFRPSLRTVRNAPESRHLTDRVDVVSDPLATLRGRQIERPPTAERKEAAYMVPIWVRPEGRPNRRGPPAESASNIC